MQLPSIGGGTIIFSPRKKPAQGDVKFTDGQEQGVHFRSPDTALFANSRDDLEDKTGFPFIFPDS